MNYDTKASLIGELNAQFVGNKDLRIDTANFIETTGTMECTALGLDMDTLQKTKNVIEQHERKFQKKDADPMHTQYLLHLKVAKKCVEEIMCLKRKTE